MHDHDLAVNLTYDQVCSYSWPGKHILISQSAELNQAVTWSSALVRTSSAIVNQPPGMYKLR